MNSKKLILFTILALTVTVFAAEPVIRTHVLPKGAICTHRPDECAPGLACDGKGSVKKCIVYKQPGMRCPARENFWICEPGLTCESDICKLPRGAVCNKFPDQCSGDLACDGKGSVKKCIVYKQPGMGCPIREQFWICIPGLTCEDDICKIPRGGVCNAFPDQCAGDLACDGKSSTKKCLVYKQAGMPCPARENFWICDPGLLCQRDICKIPIGAACGGAPTQCESGSICTRSGNRQVCTPLPRKLGQTCDATFKCERDLSCDGRCKLPKKASCLRNPTLCVRGTVCSGTRLRKLCSPVRGRGHRCSTVGFLPCAPGLSCVNNVCARGTIPVGDKCRGTHEVCKAGLVCAGPSNNRICVPPMAIGKECRTDPYWECEDGARCLHNVCVEY